MKNIEIARLELNGELENRLEELMNNKARDFDLKSSFGPVTDGGKIYVFFVFEKTVAQT